jgi:chromatin structure-remodeling complex subunit RSC1/2
MFVKITNWNGCIPEEVREESGGGGEFMPIYPFEKVIWPKKVGSPFLVGRGGAMKGVKGPGGIVNVPVSNGVDGGGDGDNTRKKPRSDGNSGKTQQQQQQQQQSPTLGPDRSIITAAGGITAIGGPSQVEKLPADTGKFLMFLFDIVDPPVNLYYIDV